ncbi:MAG: ATP-binding protein, partial [Chloroflexota bacterium]
LVTVYADPTKEALATELSHFAALQATTPAQQKIMLDFLDAGQPVFMPEVSDEFLVKITENEYRFSLLKQMNMRSCMKIPMVVPNRKVGILSLYYTESGRRYQQKDLTLIEELARRLALAIDNALLYREAKKMIEVQKELDYLKDLFMSVASHELRTPLTVITGYAQTLQKNLLNRWPYDDEQSQQNFLDRNSRAATAIVQQSIRLNNLIGQLLDFSRIQNKKLEMQYTSEVNLTELVQRVVEQQQYVRMEHTLNMAIAATEEPVIGTFDEGRLEQVLNNLIGNAIKYSPSGTTVTVGLNRSLPLGQFQGETPSEEAVIWVKDEGYGIEEEAQANLFDRFYRVRTTKNARVDGLGLGLYISQEFIKQHGGRMWLDSQVGRGSTFYFALPIRKDISSVLGAEGVHVAPSTLPYRSEKV